MSKYNLISIDSIISKLYRDLKHSIPDIDEADIIEWTGEALQSIGAFKQLEEAVCFIDIENHRGNLPSGLSEIIQLAMSHQRFQAGECESTCLNPVEEECETGDCGNDRCNDLLDDDVLEQCWSQHNKYYIPEQRYLDVLNEYNVVNRYNNAYYQNFAPLRPAQSSFRSMMGLHVGNSINLGLSMSVGEYTIQGGQVVTSAQEGTVALAYTRQPLDENGYPMIPDMIEYKQAITRYITYMSSYHRFVNNEPNFRGIYEKMESDWHWYCKQAKNAMLMPSTIDEKEDLKDINHRMVKMQRGYYGYFGNITSPEFFRINGRRKY